MPTERVMSHEEQGLAKVLMFGWSGPTTYRYNCRGTLMWLAKYDTYLRG